MLLRNLMLTMLIDMFSPLAFPTGKVVYDLITYDPPLSHTSLYPFEIYRQPLVILAVADGAELEHQSYEGRRTKTANGSRLSIFQHNVRELEQELEEIRDNYPRALVHRIVLFDHLQPNNGTPLPEGLIPVPPLAQCKTTTIKTIMCDVSSMLLAEMTTLARSFQALGTIEFLGTAARASSVAPWSPSERTSRRESVQYFDSRTASPADRSLSRMSMPARSDSTTSLPIGSPLSQPSSSRAELPTTFDEIMRPGSADPKGAIKAPALSRTGTVETVRDASRDRISVQGFGANSLSERARSKGKARVGIVIGSLYLLAGRWNDALRELGENATLAKVNLDHMWHAKALDNILTTMLMLAWAGLDFQIPSICYANSEKATAPTKAPPTNRSETMQELVSICPELVDRILNLYFRAGNNTADVLPQLPNCEIIIRCSKLLATLHLADGNLHDEALSMLVVDTPFLNAANIEPPRLSVKPTRIDIAMLIFRAFPLSSHDQMSTIDKVGVLSGIAAVLGSLGYHRKKALVIRELVSVLVPGLIQARIKGAADIGLHPAASLAAVGLANGNINGASAFNLSEGDVENGVDSFLGILTQIYGVVTSESSIAGGGGQDKIVDDSNQSVVARIMKNASTRHFGNQGMKLDVLRSCIDLSEALPDFQGVLTFAVDLLRTAGSGVAPGPRNDASPYMSREEQIRIASTISRTLNAAHTLGVQNLEADYWDEFLVRGVTLEALSASRTPMPHDKKELSDGETGEAATARNPFLYNPSLKAPTSGAVSQLLVAGERAAFKVVLQNPYEFELDIESIELEAEGAAFVSSAQRTTIGPYRTQILVVSGTPQAAGPLRITGCTIRVHGCRKRRFPIFTEPWSPQQEIKIKGIGLKSLSLNKYVPANTDLVQTMVAGITPLPQPSSLSLTIIDKQPVLAIISTTLSQNALMVLDGEKRTFSLTLQNQSKDTPADLLFFSFKDTTQASLQTAMGNRDATPAELYEYEFVLARKQALRWVRDGDDEFIIKPGASRDIEIEVLGKPGLTGATVFLDYGHLAGHKESTTSNFHTRQLKFPITVTVNASVELARLDALPLSGSLPQSLWSSFTTMDDKVSRAGDQCLLMLDFRNTWPNNLRIHLDVLDVGTIEEDILPGNTSRVLVPIKRIFLADPHVPIPALDPSRQRQFVVSASRISAETERATRETFWYREALFHALRGTWNTTSGPPRSGDIELRSLRLTRNLIDVIAVEDIDIEVSIDNTKKQRCGTYQVALDSFANFVVRITNRTKEPISPLLRLQPNIKYRAQVAAADLSKKLIWNGVLQQTLPHIAGGETRHMKLGFTALCKGEFEIGASVEETQVYKARNAAPEDQHRSRSNTQEMFTSLLGPNTRRVWHSPQLCTLHVVDMVEQDESSTVSGEDDEFQETGETWKTPALF